jgi:DNA-binding IclR family transcriptional regulator
MTDAEGDTTFPSEPTESAHLTHPSEPTAPSGKVQSVDRALRLLDGVAAAGRRGETAAGLAVRCELNRATAWRLLATLEAHGMVERDPATNRYSVGLALLRLSGAAGYDGLVRRARPVLERVSRQTGETADLAATRSGGVTYIGEVAPSSVLAVSWLAREVPLHATSTGKAYLAWLEPDEVRAMLDNPLPRFTDTTITDVEELMADLARTRVRGYAECAGELEPTLFGVSAPILGVHGRPTAVFSIWGPISRVPVGRFPLLGPVAIEAAAEVQAVMSSLDLG